MFVQFLNILCWNYVEPLLQFSLSERLFIVFNLQYVLYEIENKNKTTTII